MDILKPILKNPEEHSVSSNKEQVVIIEMKHDAENPEE